MQRWHDAAQRDPGTLRAVAFGIRSPSGLERAVGARISDPDWHARLAAALADFPETGWVPAQLEVPDGDARL